MKSLVVAGTAVVMVAGAVSPSYAFTLSPPNTLFTDSGLFSVRAPTYGLGCVTKFKGKVYKNGVGKIIFANFENGGNCDKRLQPVGIPWRFKATGMGKGKLLGVAVTAYGATCGPSTIPVQISGTGVITFTNVSMAGNCTVDGSMHSKPRITTVP